MVDEMEFLTFVQGLDNMKELQSVRSSVLEENKTMAQDTLDEESSLKKLHEEVSDLKKNYESKLAHLQSLQKEQAKFLAPPDQRTVLKELTKAKKEAFEESEQFAEDWVEDGNNPRSSSQLLLKNGSFFTCERLRWNGL